MIFSNAWQTSLTNHINLLQLLSYLHFIFQVLLVQDAAERIKTDKHCFVTNVKIAVKEKCSSALIVKVVLEENNIWKCIWLGSIMKNWTRQFLVGEYIFQNYHTEGKKIETQFFIEVGSKISISGNRIHVSSNLWSGLSCWLECMTYVYFLEDLMNIWYEIKTKCNDISFNLIYFDVVSNTSFQLTFVCSYFQLSVLLKHLGPVKNSISNFIKWKIFINDVGCLKNIILVMVVFVILIYLIWWYNRVTKKKLYNRILHENKGFLFKNHSFFSKSYPLFQMSIVILIINSNINYYCKVYLSKDWEMGSENKEKSCSFLSN